VLNVVLLEGLMARFDGVGTWLHGVSDGKEGLDARSSPNVNDGVSDGV
jgi:hypothetical protein